MDNQNPTNFDLDESILDLVFEAIEEDFTKGRKQNINPRLALIVGQPGAGKSTILTKIVDEFGAENLPVVVDMDELRLYHPFNAAIFKAHPFLYDDITGRAAGKWNAKLLELARDKKFETIYQTTLAKRFFAEKIIREFGGQGYDVSLHCLAVPSKLSILGIYDRFEHDFQTNNVPRWVDIPHHDMAYVEFPVNAQAFETELPLSRVAAYRRDGTVVYENKRAAYAWGKKPRVQTVIEKDRSKPWSQRLKNEHVAKWTDVVARYVRRFTGMSEEFVLRVVESKEFLKEATLFASAIPAKKGEAVPNGVDTTTTHHHVFIQRDGDGKLIAFDRSPVAAPTVPVSSAKGAVPVAASSPKGPV